MYEYVSIRLGELQVNSKKNNQLLYAIGSMLRVESMEYPMTYLLSSEQELFLNKWKLRWCFKNDLITKTPDGDEKEHEAAKFWWSVETNCFTRVFGDEMRGYLETMAMNAYPDQVVIKKEESSGDELQEGSSSSEVEEEEELEEEGKEDIDNESVNSYSSALTTMDWGLRTYPECQEDYWIGDSSFCKETHSRKSKFC